MRGKGAIFPENAGTAFGGDDGVVGVFQNEDAVGDTDSECTSAATFSDDDGDDGDAKIKHFTNIDGDGFGDVAFFTGNAGEGAGSVDEGDDGETEAIGQAHEAKGFSISLGVSAAEIAHQIFFGIAAFLVAEKDHALVVEGGKSAHEGSVFPESAIAPQFEELGGSLAEVVEEVGALGVANDLDALPRGKVSIDLLACGGPLLLQGGDFGLSTQLLLTGKLAKLLDAFF